MRLCPNVPEGEEQYRYNDGQDSDRPVFRLSKHFVQAVQECSYPQEPLQNRRQHNDTNDGRVNNLCKALAQLISILLME